MISILDSTGLIFVTEERKNNRKFYYLLYNWIGLRFFTSSLLRKLSKSKILICTNWLKLGERRKTSWLIFLLSMDNSIRLTSQSKLIIVFFINHDLQFHWFYQMAIVKLNNKQKFLFILVLHLCEISISEIGVNRFRKLFIQNPMSWNIVNFSLSLPFKIVHTV